MHTIAIQQMSFFSSNTSTLSYWANQRDSTQQPSSKADPPERSKQEKQMDLLDNNSNGSSKIKSILHVFGSYFLAGIKSEKKKQQHKPLFISSGGGLQPHSPPRKTDAYTTPQTVTAPIAIVDDWYDDSHDWAYLSKSDSTTATTVSSFSSAGGSSSWSSINSNVTTTHHHRTSISSITLSEILCDHYVQTHTTDQSRKEPVPLETYRVFEASRRNSTLSTTTRSSYNDDDDDDDESWFIWDNLQKTREWIQVVDEELLSLPKEKVTTEVVIAVERKARDMRANSAHLRMIVAEVNMMRADKIVCPLRPRTCLPARRDTFKRNTPSPLSKK